jgi:hypothetical protein
MITYHNSKDCKKKKVIKENKKNVQRNNTLGLVLFKGSYSARISMISSGSSPVTTAMHFIGKAYLHQIQPNIYRSDAYMYCQEQQIVKLNKKFTYLRSTVLPGARP